MQHAGDVVIRPGSSGIGTSTAATLSTSGMNTEKVSLSFAALAIGARRRCCPVTTRKFTPWRCNVRSPPGKLRGHYTHGIEDVLEVAFGEVAGLGQGRRLWMRPSCTSTAIRPICTDFAVSRWGATRYRPRCSRSLIRLRLRRRTARSRMSARVGRSSSVGLAHRRFIARMPIENERKFVPEDDGTLEARLMTKPRRDASYLRQAHLESSGLRIRSMEQSGRHDPPRLHLQALRSTTRWSRTEHPTSDRPIDFIRLGSSGRETP